MNQEIEDNIRNKVRWLQLPTHIKQILGNSSKDYDRYIVNFSIKNQLRYRGNLVRYVLHDEKRYYERIIAYSKERLMLYPYHLADMIVKGLRITPFNYYIGMVERLIQTEKSYDTLPNFTAADCLRLLGIGRNEYIELMNRARSNKARLFGKKNVRELLPKVPCDIFIAPWWRVEVGLVLEDDIKMVNEEELALIDKLIDLGSQTAGELNYYTILNLYKKGLIYLDVPITAVDCIHVPPLQGFVMNRIIGDYFETLLYKIFVSIDKHTTIGEIANVLQVDLELVKQAVSLYCRLKFAYKLFSIEDYGLIKIKHPSWDNLPPLQFNKETTNSLFNEDTLLLNDSPDSGQNLKRNRVAFLYDSTLTAFLMMGNLSPGLKKHAVTMFEVGKLCDEGLDSLLIELENVSLLDADGEGEARRFFDHAVILKSTIIALKKIPNCSGLDLIRLESLHSLDEATRLRLLQKKYNLLVSMAPLSREVRSVGCLSPPHLGPSVPEVNSLWFKLFLYHITGYGPPSLLLAKGTILKRLPHMFLGYSRILVTTWLHEPTIIPISNIFHINGATQYSPVLIQAYSIEQQTTVDIEFIPFPFQLQNTNSKDYQFYKHQSIQYLSEIVDFKHNCGYLTFINTGVRDFGCSIRSKTVQLDNQQQQQQQQSKHINNNHHHHHHNNNNTSLTITNENFSFSKIDDDNNKEEITTNNSENSSPINGFTSKESSELLQEEIDKLCKDDNNEKISIKFKSTTSIESLLSPIDGNINMFNRHLEEQTTTTTTTTTVDINTAIDNNRIDGGDKKIEEEIVENKGEIWTLLDCHFGVPLFDVNASTKICDAIVSGGLTNPESLQELVESSRRLGEVLLDFISQCQYRPGENMEIIKRGRLVPLPRYNLIFDNGRISEWPGK